MKHSSRSFRSPLFKGVVFSVWLLLFALLLHRDYFVTTVDVREAAALERDLHVEFQGIYFKDRKIGYVESHFLPEKEGGSRLRQIAAMQLNIAGQTYPVDLRLDARLGRSDLLEQFTFDFTSPLYNMAAEGRVTGNEVAFSLDTGSSVIRDTITLDGPPMLSTSRRSYLLGPDLSPGDKVRIPWFDPMSLTAKETLVEYRGRERTLIHNRVFNLHRFTEVFAGARLNSWLDEGGNVVKEESAAGFVFIKEPEFKAKSIGETSSDLLAGVAVHPQETMPDLSGRSSMRYRLALPEEGDFDLDGGRQRYRDDILTVELETIPAAATLASPSCAGLEAALMSSPYVQSASPEIVEQSLAITAGSDNTLEKTRRLAEWVYTSLEKRPVIGIPDALTTLHQRVGDCNEHASLFAALARAAGIPTKIAAGVVFNKDAFYYHAWNEVCVGDRWLSVDTTTNQLPADLSHLRFVEGELQEQIRIGALLNTLQIKPLSY